MADEAAVRKGSDGLKARDVYVLAGICLAVGLTLGYFFRGSQSPAPAFVAETASSGNAQFPATMPSLEQMKAMADKKAQPLLDKLQSDPRNAGLLAQVGDVYKQMHQFQQAADYYQRSLQVDPANAGVRSDYASMLYYNGDVEGALGQLQTALTNDPKNGAALFNLGMIRYKGKNDNAGAVAAWEELLKSNPQLGGDRKAAVTRLIAEASASRKTH